MILIITHKEDYTADYLVNKLNKKKISYYRFNCEDVNSIPYVIARSARFNLSFAKEKDFHSVWYRRTRLPQLTSKNIAENSYLLKEYESLLSNFFLTISAKKWLSTPTSVGKAENKAFQLKTALSIGFTIPDTLITNDKNELLRFAAKHNEKIVIKPLSNGRVYDGKDISIIFTNILKKSHLDNIEKFDITPCIFQEYINKEYELRITVVGNKVFSAKVNSQSDKETEIDWRRKKLKFEACKLPKKIELNCIKLVKSLDLHFGAIDMIKTKEGKYYFLEINPNGQWAWIELDTKLKISDAIINFLTK
jgi:hypothetical protein